MIWRSTKLDRAGSPSSIRKSASCTFFCCIIFEAMPGAQLTAHATARAVTWSGARDSQGGHLERRTRQPGRSHLERRTRRPGRSPRAAHATARAVTWSGARDSQGGHLERRTRRPGRSPGAAHATARAVTWSGARDSQGGHLERCTRQPGRSPGAAHATHKKSGAAMCGAANQPDKSARAYREWCE